MFASVGRGIAVHEDMLVAAGKYARAAAWSSRVVIMVRHVDTLQNAWCFGTGMISFKSVIWLKE